MLKTLKRPLFAAAIGTAVLLAGTVFASAQDVPELKLAVADGNAINPTTDSVLRLADTLGYFTKHGVKVTIISLDGTPQAIAALNSGAVDLADVTIDSVIRLRADNDVKVRGVVAASLGPAYLVAAKDDIKSVKDLVGRSFAIADNGSLDHVLTQAVLGDEGVATDGPKYVAIGAPAARVQALAAGRVDATTVSFGTFLPIADTPGIKVLVSPEDFAQHAPVLTKFVTSTEATIAAKHDAIQRFTEALIDLSRNFTKDPESWVTAMVAARDDLKKDNLEGAVKPLADRWCVNGCMNLDMLQKSHDFIYKNPDFKDVKQIAITDVIDPSFVDKAVQDMGAATGSIDTH